MENYLTKLNEVTGAKGGLVEVGDHFPSLKMQAGDESERQGEDPHWWHSIDNMKRATAVVREELAKIDPADKQVFAANADAYTTQLDALQKWAKSEIAKLPRNKRELVTSHDAFGYFARDFGFTVHPIAGLSPEDEPSSKKVADIIATIKNENVKAVFFENLENPKVLGEITRETGAKIGGELYADGLGEGDAATYDGMFRRNVTTIVNALK
jgi:ABC-type Zn uptake system ZnuABC Zn-binding protein ZnuA